MLAILFKLSMLFFRHLDTPLDHFCGNHRCALKFERFLLGHQTDDHRGQLIANVISNSDHITLNSDTPECQTPQYNKHLHQISPRCLTHNTTGRRGQLNTHYHLNTYPSLPQSTYDMTTYCNKTDEHSQFTNYKKADWTKFTEDTEFAFAQTTIPTNIHSASRIFTIFKPHL